MKRLTFGDQASIDARNMARRRLKPRGYVMPPGSGPEGETCGSCAHVCRFRQSKALAKCGLNKRIWTGSRTTDVNVTSPACSKWQPAPPEV